jgi:hypothetical protein
MAMWLHNNGGRGSASLFSYFFIGVVLGDVFILKRDGRTAEGIIWVIVWGRLLFFSVFFFSCPLQDTTRHTRSLLFTDTSLYLLPTYLTYYLPTSGVLPLIQISSSPILWS